MKYLLPGDQTFSAVQEINGYVDLFDTMFTVPSKGMIYRPATAKATFGAGIDFRTATIAQMNAHFDSNTVPGILDETGTEVFGRIPILHDYWGTGAPAGVGYPNCVALRISGFVKQAGSYALVFSGRGNVKVYRNNVALIGTSGTSLTEIAPRASALTAFSKGDRIDIFFWAVDEPWGGISCRVTSNAAAVAGGKLDWSLLREADVLAASFMDDGSVLAPQRLTAVSKIEVEVQKEQTPSLNIVLASAPAGNPNGWYYDPALGNAVSNSAPAVTIRKGHLVQFTGGYGDDALLLREFTGSVDDIVPSRDGITVKCVGFEHRASRQLSENYPDRISYAGWGYTSRTGLSEPVWNVPAFDHWPYEHAIKELCYRAWIDPSLLRANKLLLRVGQSVPESGAPLFYCRTLSGEHIRVSRQPHYGNPDGSPESEPDDSYLTSSELTKTLYQRIKDLVARIGYDFRTNAWGQIVFRPVQRPVALTPLVRVASGGVEAIHPSSIGGKYRKMTGTSWSWTISHLKASRIELVVVRKPGYGTVRAVVARAEDGATFTTTHSLDVPVASLGNLTEAHYYDGIANPDGSNICVLPLLTGEDYGTYSVTLTPVGGAAGTEYGLDALLLYEEDPLIPRAEFLFRTAKNALELASKSNATERLNDAIVTGKMRSTLTDSQKVQDQVEFEYIVSRAQDTRSILDPTASNYMGGRITAFLSDESIGDESLAEWTANALVRRYRIPKPDLTIRHTAIPALELGDPIYAQDDALGTFDATTVMWVSGFTTTYDFGKNPSATVSIEASPFPATPSYQPPEEIDISVYGNKPVINLNVVYPSLSGGGAVVTNPGGNSVVMVDADDRVSVNGMLSSDASGLYLTIPTDVWSPGSELLTVGVDPNIQVFKNYPYYTYYKRASATRLDVPFQGGDGSAAYRAAEYGIGAGTAATLSYIKIRDPYAGVSPFYDPYASDLPVPKLISVSFDALVSGYYRVSMVDARDGQTVVAWLTGPANEESDGQKHWTYMLAGAGKLFTWDGVDTRGEWNRKQTADLSAALQGAFPEIAGKFEIGAGFFAHNDSLSGLAHISGEVSGLNAAYPVGHYSQFFVRVECIRTDRAEPLRVESRNADDLYDTAANHLAPRFVYTHLHPLPNRVETDICDWNYSVEGAYDPLMDSSAPPTAWNATPDTDATLRDAKPVRVTITVLPRPGALFANDPSNSFVKVHRVVGLNAVCLDESMVFYGLTWNAGSASEEKRIIARRTTNKDHTVIYKDPAFSAVDEVQDWIFYPSLFEDDFGKGPEPIRYLDYTQLFEVPHWNPQPRVGEKRSRYLLGYLSYLFYLSVFTQDRSGRLAWSIDPTHVDKSKVLTNADPMSWPFDLERHQRRVLYCRQWWDSDKLEAEYGASKWNVEPRFRGLFSDRFDPFDNEASRALYPLNNGSTVTGSLSTGELDPFSNWLKTNDRLPDLYDANRALGSFNPVTQEGTTKLGRWTWETNGFVWIPNFTRDTHPYYRLPPMGLTGRERQLEDENWYSYWSLDHVYGTTDLFIAGTDKKPIDEAQYDTWFTFVNSLHQTGGLKYRYHFWPGFTVADYCQDNKINKIPDYVADYQRVDDIVRYEDSRGSASHGTQPARDRMFGAGGNPYYLNPMRYTYFRTHHGSGTRPTQNFCDVDERGWFSLTFRHTYVWESPSLFPLWGVDPVNTVSWYKNNVPKFRAWHRNLLPAAIDADLTQAPVVPGGYDPGAWVGWKDDHPSAMQAAGAFHDTGTCNTLHWRYAVRDGGSVKSGKAGGSCGLDNPAQDTLSVDGRLAERLPCSYELNENLFLTGSEPFAVGPRLPETRRVLFALALVNDRRESPITF